MSRTALDARLSPAWRAVLLGSATSAATVIAAVVLGSPLVAVSDPELPVLGSPVVGEVGSEVVAAALSPDVASESPNPNPGLSMEHPASKNPSHKNRACTRPRISSPLGLRREAAATAAPTIVELQQARCSIAQRRECA